MRHNGHWEESWYDRHARENNPLRNGFTTIGDLESSVNGTSIEGHYSNNGFTRGAGIGSSLLLAAYMLIITACGGQAAPTPSPTSSTQRAISTPAARQETSAPQPTLEATVTAASPTPPPVSAIIDRPTYDVIFTFKEPSNDMERALLKTTDAVTYMQFLRTQNNFDLNVSLAKIVGDFFGNDYISITFDTINAYKQAIKSLKLNEVYVSLDTIQVYLNSLPINQTRVEAKPFYFQQTATRELIPIESLGMDNETFFALKKKYSNPFVALALSKSISEDIVNKLHSFSKDKSLEEIDRRIISILANSHPEVQRVLSDQLMEEGSTPFGSVPAYFNYRDSEIKELDRILGPFEAMKKLPFVEGKNVLLFYQPTYYMGRDAKFDTKEFLDKVEAIKILDLAYDIQTELVGYRKFGDQKRLILHSFDFSFTGGQPIITGLINQDFIGHPIILMGNGNIPTLMYSFLNLDFDYSSKHLELLTLNSTVRLIYGLTLEKLVSTHANKFGPEVQKPLDRVYKEMIDQFALAFKYVSDPKTDNAITGISIIRKVGENQGEDFYKNFFHIWNNVKPYVSANPGVVNDQYPYTNFFRSDGDGKRINDSELVSNTLVISALSAAAGKDLRQQFSEYRMINVHQGLFDKTLPFFRNVLDYSRNAKK